MKIAIEKVNNGWIVEAEGCLRGDDGRKVFKATEELLLLEALGKMMLDQRVKVEFR